MPVNRLGRRLARRLRERPPAFRAWLKRVIDGRAAEGAPPLWKMDLAGPAMRTWVAHTRHILLSSQLEPKR